MENNTTLKHTTNNNMPIKRVKFRGNKIVQVKVANSSHYYDTEFITEFPIGNYYMDTYGTLGCLLGSKQKFNLKVRQYFEKEGYNLIWEHKMTGTDGCIDDVKSVFEKDGILASLSYKAESAGNKFRGLDLGDVSGGDIVRAEYVSVTLYYKDTEAMEKVSKGIRKYAITNKSRSKISLLTSSHGHLETMEQDIKSVDIDIEANYGADFMPVHLKIISKLNEDRGKGLVLLHGVPGTGKTNYIRYLCKLLKKEIIFLPPFLAENLASPDFITFLLEHTNSILVIEDAEKVVLDREGEHSNRQSVANLLNVTDGILSDCLSIQIIATFNTSRDRIDKALLRKGRLIAEWKFDALSVEDTNNLLKSIGRELNATKPMTLTEIYNVDEEEFVSQQERPQIGFGR